ncbi:MAG: helix-turn-helix domain-containing protein [Proteiniphilum sp.]|uniref:IclR family transcriptional regulator n=1 Tax=Proteiniphilum sp. TaxID=1926877 RepID=UPI002ABA33EC|nr:helix-turn-helix domain-containing protein [Proteiniphilum sp.]MDY9918728.1 helix-turn-helix domain-containing protein [Proteiniphilum sp.]
MIQVINRALSILELIAKEPEKEVRLSEIADTLELNHSTCANILKTLINRDYVEQAVVKGGYKLGPMAFQLTNSNFYNMELLNAAKRPMQNLIEEINETVILSVIKNYKRVLLKEIPCSHEIQVRTTNQSSVYKATTGRVILSYYSPKEIEDFISKVGLPSEEDWPEVKTKEELFQKLNEIKNNQFELSHNKNHVVGLATPIFKNKKVEASLGVYLPDIRFGKGEKNKIINALKVATTQINRNLSRNNS